MGFIADIIRKQAADGAGRPALSFDGKTRTFGLLDERSSRVAQALLAEGLRPQDRVAFLDRNTPECIEVLLGCSKANVVYTAINWRLSSRELAYPINDAGARVLVIGTEFLPALESFREDLTTVEKIVVLGSGTPYRDYEDWITAAPPLDPRAPSADDDIAVILYTSGTTGNPKGVMLTSANLGCTIGLASPIWGFDRDSVSLAVLPAFHIGGCGWVLCGLLNGSHTVMLRLPDPAAIVAAIERYRVTISFLVPAILQMVIEHPGTANADLSSFRQMIYGAAPISRALLVRALERFRCNFFGCYGLTESTNGLTILAPEEHDPNGRHTHRLASIGVPFPWANVRIVDPESGKDVAEGQVGEVWIKSKGVMKGYWGSPADTVRTVTPGGWLRSGDAGYVDPDGYIYLVDRIKDMIISGGENIYPVEIENVLMDHPAVSDVAVIGVPDERWGETVKAIVIRVAGAEVTADEVIQFARVKMAHYKCPTSVDFVDALPRNASGKVLKKELREPYWRGKTRRIH